MLLRIDWHTFKNLSFEVKKNTDLRGRYLLFTS